MHSIRTLVGVTCATLLVSAGPALAQTPPTTSAAPTTKAKDPNRIICERIKDTSSRIGGKKVCMTATQWEDQRRRDREYVEDAQQRSLEPNSG